MLLTSILISNNLINDLINKIVDEQESDYYYDKFIDIVFQLNEENIIKILKYIKTSYKYLSTKIYIYKKLLKYHKYKISENENLFNMIRNKLFNYPAKSF